MIHKSTETVTITPEGVADQPERLFARPIIRQAVVLPETLKGQAAGVLAKLLDLGLYGRASWISVTAPKVELGLGWGEPRTLLELIVPALVALDLVMEVKSAGGGGLRIIVRPATAADRVVYDG